MVQVNSSTERGKVSRDGRPVGLFIGSWETGKDRNSTAPKLTLDLMFDAVNGRVNGYGNVSAEVSTNPPLDIHSRCDGEYTYLTVMPEHNQIIITLVGYPTTQWAPHGGLGLVLEPNLKVHMLLTSDWESGTATYSYRTFDDQWHQIESVPVHKRAVAAQAGSA